MTMGRLDEEFSKKKAAQLKRKLGSAPSSTITSQDIPSEDQNQSFGEYAVMFYIPYFLTANIRADAAVDDLILFKKLKKVPAGDKLLADEALATLSCHLWFSAPALSCSPSPVRSWRTGR